MKQRVTGIGGIFFKAEDPKKLGAWYKKHLGIPVEEWGGWGFRWRDAKNPKKSGHTIWSPFGADTDYFKPSKKPFMVNLRVDNLKRVLAELKREGIAVDPKVEESEFGKFSWIMDPEGTRIELWEPPVEKPKKKSAKKAPKKKAKTVAKP
ncbi:MAG: VOC family protein [Verrucomicrobiota bacterium]